MTRIRSAVLAAFIAVGATTPAVAATPPRPLRNVDVRKADGGPVTPTERRARSQLERSLGDEGVVETDRVSGGARLVARTDGYLTARRSAPATAVALEYVREHPDVFGIGAPDLAGLRLTDRYRSDDGVTHLAYTQTYRDIASYDNVLLANVDERGRLLDVGGSAISDLRVDSIVPDVSAGEALAAAREEAGGALVAPRATQAGGPERATTFAGGDSARLVLFSDGRLTRLAWRVIATGAHDWRYEVVVDAASGATLKRRSLTEFASNASVFRDYPGAPDAGGTPLTVDLAQDPTWLSHANDPPNNPKLSGNNVHAYVDADANNVDPAPAPQAFGPTAGDLEIHPSSGTDWLYPLTTFPGVAGCSPAGSCTWNPASPSSRATNRNEATTQLFYYVNLYHDHLADMPISFTPAARNFEGSDPVQAETDNFLNPDGTAPNSVNNASMTTLPDGTSPLMQMQLFTSPARNAADSADVVYHEYTHGLTNRSVGSGVGLDANQSRAMGEAWSDWYALDFLDLRGMRNDTGGTDGEMTIGDYLHPGGLRTQGADCPVGPSSPASACPGAPGAGAGGYTFGDMGKIAGTGFEVHADGEIWLETLWDLRRQLGSPVLAEALVTGGLRLAPNNPSFLEARDAILLADQQQTGGSNHDLIWAVFAARGMGYDATTSSQATSAVDGLALPPRLEHVTTNVSDPAPGGDGDGVPEPGETIEVSERVRNPHNTVTSGPAPGVLDPIPGVLSTTAPGVSIAQGAATWQPIGAGQADTSAPVFQVTLPPLSDPNASCDSTLPLDVAVQTDASAFSLPLRVPLGSRASDDPPQAITPTPASITSTVDFSPTGLLPDRAVNDLEVRIGKLTHTWVGDLKITLTHGAKSVVLMNRPGAGPEGAQGDDFTDLVLDDDAATPIDAIPDTNPPGGYTGRFKPDSPLSVFDGDDRSGTWTLKVEDLFAPQDSGTLESWSIRPSGLDCPNRAPIAAADAFSVAGGQSLTAANVVANDEDPDGDAITAVKLSDPAHGSVTLDPATGAMTYTPQRAFKGTDSFTYRVRDAHNADSAPVTVSISVGNTPPAAGPDSFSATSGVALAGTSVLANDSDPNGDGLIATLASGPAHGTLALSPGGTFTYTPDPSFAGRDAFTYQAFDGTDSSPPATVTIDVAAAPVPPPPPPPPAPPPPPVVRAARAPAKLQVLRAGVSAGRLDVLASITSRATGNVHVTYRSGGATSSFEAPISGGQIRLRKTLSSRLRRQPTGIFKLEFAGSSTVAPDSVALRAARGKARLVRTSSRIDASGRLSVAGTISRRARGIVRVRLGYVSGTDTAFLYYRAPIANGRWSLVAQLPAAAAKAGGQLSIQFTGYGPLRIRGEQIAKDVAGG